ncbi:TIGR03915 family putative DNA repair protein [Neolewinella lacunae]|uniref:TIGR03915 family putative DNA repair protein n=1 Tax=Neolewinella lacunae TaxID=1517758 RepID=A0A923T9A6_9BACT|nr:TIGR03915 family putative DNA repair protein [Neolewinella lacunae]MBC6994858.1 TIGR03915 family putative DNA repair protein [Neolewinella lacunae]MDN3636778.1 TIGR03915 family putative DNA repair protein [Neolewinella lacunae]
MILTYDGTFAGLFSAIFEAYRLGLEVEDIVAEDVFQQQLFSQSLSIVTNDEQARRVGKSLDQKGGSGTTRWLRRAFLTEQAGTERLIYHFIRRQLVSEHPVRQDASDERIRRLQRLDQQMGREVHRMHAFVRFQELPDGLYVALIQPDFNCLPLLGDHFAARYPAMPWLIYDTRRHYGLHWDVSTRKAAFITLESGNDGHLRQLSQDLLAAKETAYQDLWKQYFHAVDIPERRNIPLHLQHVPKRYWKYLTEK